MIKILTINGSYRDDGIIDQSVEALAQALELDGAEVEIILLRELPIEFCLNCRACTQQPGAAPGECVIYDSMQELIDKIERADCYILAAPTNFSSVTAIFKRFMERLAVYAFWSWDMNRPQFRKAQAPKKKAAAKKTAKKTAKKVARKATRKVVARKSAKKAVKKAALKKKSKAKRR